MEIKSKNCSICEELKPLPDFVIYYNKYYSSACKQCINKLSTIRYRTKEGLVSRIYSHQRESCRKRNYDYPKYSLLELREWCLLQDNYHKQYELWKDSNYNFKLTPSIDRLDDYKTYAIDNIQILSTIENIRKGNLDAKNGINNKMNKSVAQYSLNGDLIRTFYSLKDAERATGIRNGNISNCCSFKYKTAGGYVWKYC